MRLQSQRIFSREVVELLVRGEDVVLGVEEQHVGGRLEPLDRSHPEPPLLVHHVIGGKVLPKGDCATEVVEARALKAELCNALAFETSSFVSQSLYASSSRILSEGAPLPTGVR